MRIKQGDTVIVIAGNDKGETGEVTQVLSRQNRIVVAGVNRRTKHQKPRQAGRTQVQGGIVEFEAPINISNVMLVCPHTSEPTRIGVRRDEDGKPVRFSKKSGKDI
ncbi:MAG: large subunit ribosomal protein L24 [Cellvibrionaceae bacterium]|jgi:large subunit ribosomal protein L24